MGVVAVWVGYGVFRGRPGRPAPPAVQRAGRGGVGAFAQRARRRAGLRRPLRRRRCRTDPARLARRRHERLAPRHRHRRGGHHRARRLERRRRPARPRPRRPRPPARPRAARPRGRRRARRRPSPRPVLASGSLVIVLVAGVLSASSFYASGHPDGLSTSRSTSASTRQRSESATVGLTAGRLLRRRRRRRAGCPVASPGSSASPSSGWSWPGSCSSCGAARPARARPEVGSGHGATCTSTAPRPLHRMPAHAKLVGLVAFVLARRLGAPRGDRLALVGLLLLAVGVLLASTRVSAAAPPAPAGRRAAVRGLRAAAAVRRPRPPGGRSGRSRCREPGLDGGGRAAAQGHLRRRRGRRVRRDDPTARPRACPAAPAGARHPRHHRGRSWCATSTSSATRCAG